MADGFASLSLLPDLFDNPKALLGSFLEVLALDEVGNIYSIIIGEAIHMIKKQRYQAEGRHMDIMKHVKKSEMRKETRKQ